MVAMTHESTGHNDALIFCGLLDARFETGTPRRHAPGTGAGEEEVLLEPSAEVMDFILGPPPEMVRAVRPKFDNFRPVRERRPKEIVGHRLEIRQHIGEDKSTFVFTTYFIHTSEELKAQQPPQLREEKSGREDSQYARHRLPTGEVMSENLGPLRRYDHRNNLSPERTTELFRFIGGCTCRAPRAFE